MEKETTVFEENEITKNAIKSTGGLWSTRKPQFWRSLGALFKRDFITKIRHFPSIIEFIGACIITFLLYPVWLFARSNVPASSNPPILGPFNMSEQLGTFLYATGSATPEIAIVPNNLNTQFFNSLVLNKVGEAFNITSKVLKDVDEMREYIYQTDSNCFGIHWINSDKEDARTNPQFTIYLQKNYGQPEEALLQLILTYISSNSTFVTVNRQAFPLVKSSNEYNIHIAVAFFAICPIILATMPNVQSILDDKDSRITTYMFLMGMSETQHWIVNFCMMFIGAFFPYLIVTGLLCFWFCCKGTDVGLFMVTTMLFIISHTFFMFCILTIMQKSEHGRSQAVGFAIFTIFFGYIHFFYTLQPNASNSLKHGMSVIPLSAYQLMVMTFYNRVKNGYTPYNWSNLHDDGSYPLWMGLMWLALDCAIFFVLWLILNTFMPREFGVQPMLITDIFKRSAWHTLFHGRGSADPEQIKRAENAIVVEGLDKKYNGMKPVHAVKNVSFTVKRGEVIVLIGPNGAGKSTMINTISCAIKNTGGTISLFDGPATTQFQEIHKYLGICFQENVLCGLLSVKEHFELFGALRGIAIDDLDAAIEFFSSTLQLEQVLATRARDLSGGQKRKLCLALAILGNPPLVIMDEPTAGVDVQARQLIWQTIAGLKESTCIITSHALEEAEAVSSRLFIAAHGEMPFKGTSTELRRQFNCGYLLRVDREDGKAGPVFDLAKSIIPGTVISEEREDTLIVPVDKKASELLLELETNSAKYGVKSYSFGVEQLEDTLLKMIEHAEAEIDMNH